MATITVLIDIRAAPIFIFNIYKNLLMDLPGIKHENCYSSRIMRTVCSPRSGIWEQSIPYYISDKNNLLNYADDGYFEMTPQFK
ncbi:MAG: hypothetical protein KJ568_03675 [Actinobacteria bacterium]|nr:hypothetical protein [Actinomycetota bacterium]